MGPDRRCLDSMTKYPSIPTWHVLDGKGTLTDQTPEVAADTELAVTEKVDGTNGRIVRLGDRWWIGSRDNLLVRSDGVFAPGPDNPLEHAIVDTLRPIAERTVGFADKVSVWFLEVFGSGIGSSAKEYTSRGGLVSCRLFDHAVIANSSEILSWTPERISGWRKRGGQAFSPAHEFASQLSGLVETVPALRIVKASDLPRRIEDGRPFIERQVSRTRCQLDEGALGRPEGVVVRTGDRKLIFKLRLEDYDRAMRKRHPGYVPERHAEFA